MVVRHPLPDRLHHAARIAWHITNWCNYGCMYCTAVVYHKRSRNGPPQDHAFDHQPVSRWLEAFAGFPQQELLLKITGGEPFLDREQFRELLRGILAMPRYSVQIDTNGSWDPAFFREVDKSRLSLNVAFHPRETSFPSFFRRLQAMRHEGFAVEMVNVVLAPENLESLEVHLDELQREGFFVNLSPMTAAGAYRGRRRRTRREMDLIERYNVPLDVKYKAYRVVTRGRPCWHPSISYYLLWDGRIQPQCLDPYRNLFTDGVPPLPREAVPCAFDECIGCTEMYRALADEPLVTQPLSLYYRREYVAEVEEYRRRSSTAAPPQTRSRFAQWLTTGPFRSRSG